VLLGLTRGSGGRSLAGMRRSFDHYARPLLDVSRDDTVTACQVEGIDFWDDPHNEDPGYTRVRVRRTVLPMLEEQLGPGVAEALARTADQLREDVAALDEMAETEYRSLEELDVTGYPKAIATRILRIAAVEAGAVDSELFHVHVEQLFALAHRQIHGEIQLPGHVTAYREGTSLLFRPTAVTS
jgi:tRNA(Ile)-lysidine synthase